MGLRVQKDLEKEAFVRYDCRAAFFLTQEFTYVLNYLVSLDTSMGCTLRLGFSFTFAAETF